jgi:hypothetical protein
MELLRITVDGGNAGGAWGRSKQMQQTGLMRMVCHRCHAMATGGSTWDMEEWRKKLPEKKVPLYSHSLPCIEAWLNSLGFFQSRDDRAVWLIQRPDWHAQLSLDITELYIRWVFVCISLHAPEVQIFQLFGNYSCCVLQNLTKVMAVRI